MQKVPGVPEVQVLEMLRPLEMRAAQKVRVARVEQAARAVPVVEEAASNRTSPGTTAS